MTELMTIAELRAQKVRKKRDNPEQRLQMAVADFLRLALKPPVIWSAFPAGGGGKVRGAFLKAMGLQAGWPDILVLAPGPIVLGIELKAPKCYLTPEQKEISQAFRALGGHFVLCRSIDQISLALRVFGVVPR